MRKVKMLNKEFSNKGFSKKGWMKNSSIYLIVVSVLTIIVAAITFGIDVATRLFNGFGALVAGILLLLSLPGIITGACGMGYVKKGTRGWLIASMISGWITAIIYGVLILVIDPVGHAAWLALPLIMIALILPITFFLIGCHRK